ncbi:PQQ-binding-like beta-propeller repeat protein [Pseudoneobacillus sp. C159]
MKIKSLLSTSFTCLILLIGSVGHTYANKENPIIKTEISKIANLQYSFQGSPGIIIGKPNTQTFPPEYSDISGVLTFRGNHLRDSAAYGTLAKAPTTLEKNWEFQTGRSPRWGGGAGWTGQPAIIKWPNDVKNIMNLQPEFKNNPNFVEVIYASLDGKVYFFDLSSGKQSRTPINIENPIKGSVSVDPRGYPLLYVGQGIPETGNDKIGYRIYSLIDGKLLYFLKGRDGFAYKGWGAFDGAALINRQTDTMFLGGENGLFYSIKLNTKFDLNKKSIAISPQVVKYRYKLSPKDHIGIENSVAAYKNLIFFTDNGGTLQGIDTTKMKPVWAKGVTDDSDATIVVEPVNDIPFLYTGTEVDKQGTTGNSILRKVNGLNGKTIWRKDIPALSVLGENPVNGGLLATPVLGKNDIAESVIFTIARYKKLASGLMISLDKETGKELWRWEMPNYAWSSPVVVYDQKGHSYIIQCDSVGRIHLLQGKTGKLIKTINTYGANIEASPAIYQDTIVIANRGGKIFTVKIN